MKKSFFLDLFSTFGKSELRQFRKFVASPYFNGRTQLLALLDYFTQCQSQGKEPQPEPAFAQAYPHQPFDDQAWRLAQSQLFKLAEQFIALREMEAEADFPTLHLAQAYRRRGLEKHYLRTFRNLEKQQGVTAEHSAEFYENRYRSEWEKYRYLSSGRRTENFNLQEVSDAMDAAFIARKLRHVCFSLSHQAVFRTEYRFGLLDEVLHTVKDSPTLLALPAVSLYFHCYRAMTEQSEEVFENFNSQLLELGPQLPQDEQRNLYLLAINFGIRQINASRPEYDRPVLDLYRTALEMDLLLENGKISHFAFANIVAIAVRIGATDWVGNFIHGYKNSLERKHRNVTVALSLARLEHTRQNYREALLHLQKSDYRDFINNLIVKTLQLKIYFETDELEVLEAHLRNMRTYIRRHRAFGYHRENYLNIIRFTQALVELNPFDKKQRVALRKEILAAEPLTERGWLLGRLP